MTQPSGKIGNEAWVLGGKPIYPTVPEKLWREQGITEVKDILKLIVSTAEFDATLLEQEELDLPFRATRKLSRGGGTLNRLMKKVQCRNLIATPESEELYDDWVTSQIIITTVRPQQTTLTQHQQKQKNKDKQNNPVNVVNFSEDGKLIVASTEDGTIHLWNWDDKKQDAKLRKTWWGHEGEVIGVVFSPKGKILASASFDNTVRFWSIPDGIQKQCVMCVLAQMVRYWLREVKIIPSNFGTEMVKNSSPLKHILLPSTA
ncbi:hypothetical protein NIES2130_13850 [Scytonema sp. HK-05]|uniref:WD40 repeat domain-containing protein n=1 Tax=Scytonema sp. HK-05 TaxID=1137095 RepID=UPI000936FAD0|nr:hypothetical protein NIES2130_13850 [Scytonema sp. HK-05]